MGSQFLGIGGHSDSRNCLDSIKMSWIGEEGEEEQFLGSINLGLEIQAILFYFYNISESFIGETFPFSSLFKNISLFMTK